MLKYTFQKKTIHSSFRIRHKHDYLNLDSELQYTGLTQLDPKTQQIHPKQTVMEIVCSVK